MSYWPRANRAAFQDLPLTAKTFFLVATTGVSRQSGANKTNCPQVYTNALAKFDRETKHQGASYALHSCTFRSRPPLVPMRPSDRHAAGNHQAKHSVALPQFSSQSDHKQRADRRSKELSIFHIEKYFLFVPKTFPLCSQFVPKTFRST